MISAQFFSTCKHLKIQSASHLASHNANTATAETVKTSSIIQSWRGVNKLVTSQKTDEGIFDMQGSTQQRMFSGNGADDDIVVSSARAYVSAINKMIAFVSKNEQRAAEAADQKAMRSMDEEVRVPVAQ